MIKILGIGDVVMALPLLHSIRKIHPHAHITWVAGLSSAPLLEATRLIDRLLLLNEKLLVHGKVRQKVQEVLHIWRELRGSSFDLCLNLHADYRYQIFSLLIRAKQRKTIRKENLTSRNYHATEYIRLFSQKLAKSPYQLPVLNLPDKQVLPSEFFEGKFCIGIAPGGHENGGFALRRWPIESYVQLVKQLESSDIVWILTGSASDHWVTPYFKELNVQNLIGTLSLLDLILVYQKCDLLITHDGGSLHVAKLANCPTIGLFGPSRPEEFVGAQERIEVIWGGENLPCRPCYDGKSFASCSKNVCLETIRPEVVVQKIKEARDGTLFS